MTKEINIDTDELVAVAIIKTLHFLGIKLSENEIEKLGEEIYNSKEYQNVLKKMSKNIEI